MSALPSRPSLLAHVDFGRAPRQAAGEDVRIECSENGPATLAAAGLRIDFEPWRWRLSREAARIALHAGAHRGAPGTASQAAPASTCLRLLDRDGEDFPAHLPSPFALVIVDLDQRTVYAATDRFSIHPLCVGRSGSVVVVSDRADAAAGALCADTDPQALFDYLVAHVIRAPRTLFRGVERVQDGHALRVGAGTRREIRYWRPHFTEGGQPDFRALSTAFRETVRQAVGRAAQASDVGAFLSGGTDSSTVVGMLADTRPGAPRAYSIGFDAQGYDEMRYARIAARHFGARHREHYVTPGEVAAGIPELARHFDQPFGNSSALPALCCARLAREDGVRLLLAGDGGDELYGGNTRYARQKVFEPWERLPAPLRALLGALARPGAPAARLPGLGKIASYVRQARVPMPDRLSVQGLANVLGVEAIFTPELLHAVDPGEPLRLEREVYGRTDAGALVNRMLAYDWKFTLADNDLPKVLGAAGAAGVEVAFPFLDDAVVDLSLRVPPHWKVRGFTLRWFFKQSLRGFLPAEILTKRKHGFGLPFGPWLARDRRLRELAADSFSGLRRRGWVRPELLDLLLERKLAEHAGFYGEMVWILVMLEQWFQVRERERRTLTRAA